MRKVNQAKHDERRQHIMQAAFRCFERDGFRGASISDICAEAGMSPGHLYHYFDSKDAIIRAITETRLHLMASAFEHLAQEPDLIDGMLRLMDQSKHHDQTRKTSLRVEMTAEASRNPAIAQIMREADRTSCDMLGQLLRGGQERGQIDSSIDPRIAASVLISAMDGVRQHLALDPDFGVNQSLDMMKVLIARFLRPQTAPGAAPSAAPAKRAAAKRAPKRPAPSTTRRPTVST